MRVAIVEDQAMLRESLAFAIDANPDMEVVGTFASAADCVDGILESDAEVVLMDVCTQHNASGIAATRELKRLRPSVRVVVMTGVPEITFVKQAQDAGANSFIYKTIGTEELLSVIRSTYDHYGTFPSDTQVEGLGLSEEEIAILRLVCEAKSRKEIASALFLSEGTVKRRISGILAKTGYPSILKLAVHAVSSGYIVPGLR